MYSEPNERSQPAWSAPATLASSIMSGRSIPGLSICGGGGADTLPSGNFAGGVESLITRADISICAGLELRLRY